LGEFLAAASPLDYLSLSFQQVALILGFALPPAAQKNRAWWANDKTKRQAKLWMATGWKTQTVDMSSRTVVFARTPAAK